MIDMKNTSIILRSENLRKTFITKRGKAKNIVEAVKGISLEVEKGIIFGFLGPNGAGKTTSLKMLTTLLSPTSGNANIAGFDLLREPQEIRKHIGYVSQAGGSDTSMSAIENLILQARLYGVDKNSAEKRAKDLIQQFEMTEFATRIASSYSGGQRRRLDLALGVVHRPEIVFLDEPTTGLDPQSRAHFWDEIRSINKDGTTIFVTTHYLDEADNLCSDLAIVDHGVIVAHDTPSQLKRSMGQESIIIGMENIQTIEKAKKLIQTQKYVKKLYVEDAKLVLFVQEGEKLLAQVLRFFDKNKLPVDTIALAKPSLDDVFLQKTGRSLREGESNA